MSKSEKDYIVEAHQFMQTQEYHQALDMIYQGIQNYNTSYELYFMLAQCKELLNCIEQAAVSYQNALFFSADEDYEEIEREYAGFLGEYSKRVHSVSIILVTYNQLEYTKLCVESIRQNNPGGSYEIIVVDNFSTDGTREWISGQKDIKVILNDENVGFPAACNQGAENAEEGNDIFLLNNDTILLRNSLYNLRMALYEKEETGAVGACSNMVGNWQMISERYDFLEDYASYADRNNAYDPSRHGIRLYLSGFALLCKRDAWKSAGGMDVDYHVGMFDDTDFGFRLLSKGFYSVLCRDSFIYHFGSVSFRSTFTEEQNDHLMDTNRQIFEKKWGITSDYFGNIRMELVKMINMPHDKKFSVLEIGCGLGSTLLEIKGLYPDASLYGLELDEKAVEFAGNYAGMMSVIQGNIEEGENPFGIQYDYIIFADVLEHLNWPDKTLKETMKWLKPNGAFLLSIPNICHISVLLPLLRGNFTYTDAGILDRTHLRFFTWNEIRKFLDSLGLKVVDLLATVTKTSVYEEEYINRLVAFDEKITKEELQAYQYIIKAVRE